MNSAQSQWQPSPALYIDHAREMNETARLTLRLETRDATALQAKISIGLSLQAAELAGKAILLALGVTTKEIRARHKGHKVLELLQDAASHAAGHSSTYIQELSRFLLSQPTIDGQDFGNTIGGYLTIHFAQGGQAEPRNYLYPDLEKFTGPVPIQALYIMAEDIITFADKIVRSLP